MHYIFIVKIFTQIHYLKFNQRQTKVKNGGSCLHEHKACVITMCMTDKLQRESLQIATWNCNILPRLAEFFAQNAATRAQYIADFLKMHMSGFDIIALQELFDSKHRAYIAEALQNCGYGVVTADKASESWGSGLLLAIKKTLSIQRIQFTPFKKRAMEDIFVRKGILNVQCTLPYSKLPVVISNLHMQPYKNRWAVRARHAQMQQLAEAIKQFQQPHIVAGDFNICRIKSPNEFADLLTHTGLSDLTLDKTCKPISSIAHPNKPKATKGTQPDHIFIKNPAGLLLPQKYWITNYEEWYGARFISDHLPVCAKLGVQYTIYPY